MIAIFLFYNNRCIGKPIKYTTNGIDHCGIITFDGKDYISTEMTKYGTDIRVLRVTNHFRFLKLLINLKSIDYLVAVKIKEIQEVKWLPLKINSCNEMCREISGINVGFTFNPSHLLKKLLRYNNISNYEIQDIWSART